MYITDSPWVTVFVSCEGRAQELQSSQQAVSTELGEKQSLCQQLRSTVDTMGAQLTQADETKKQVGLYNYILALALSIGGITLAETGAPSSDIRVHVHCTRV